MKRLVLTLAAMAAVAGPVAMATDAAAQNRNSDRYDNNWRGDDRYDNDRYDSDRRDDGRYDSNRRSDDRYDNNRRDNDRRDDRRGSNDRRDNNRWDDRRYNGYYLGNRWYYGAPSVTYSSRYDYRPGYRQWQRGGYLPQSIRVYVVNDWQRYRLRTPPRGYHWVRANNDYILAAIATGLILEVIAGNF